MFGNGEKGLINPPDENRYFPLKMACIAVPNMEAFGLFYDFEIISSMAKRLPEKSSRGGAALMAANRMINLFQPSEPATWTQAREEATKFFSSKNAPSQHDIIAVGHCHIDTAWLWNYAETKQKCARSWASQVKLMDEYPDFLFVCSQAQQFVWLEKEYPCKSFFYFSLLIYLLN